MMQLMMEATDVHDFPVLHQQAFEARVRDHGVEYQKLQMVDDMEGAGENDKMDQDRCQVDQRLGRMHRHTRPWTDIDVPMMQGLHCLVERLPMQEAVNPIEMERVPDRDQEQDGQKPYRVLIP